MALGQASEAPERAGYLARSPVELAAAAVRAALDDCGAVGDVAAVADTVAGIRQFEISTPFATAPFGRADNFPRAVAGRVGVRAARAILSVTGGQANQALVGELAEDVACGRSEMALLFGAEAISTVRHLQAAGERRDWAETVERRSGRSWVWVGRVVRCGDAAAWAGGADRLLCAAGECSARGAWGFGGGLSGTRWGRCLRRSAT